MEGRFIAQEGTGTHRDGSERWLEWETYKTRDEAIKAVRHRKGKWRVVERRVTWTNAAVEESRRRVVEGKKP